MSAFVTSVVEVVFFLLYEVVLALCIIDIHQEMEEKIQLERNRHLNEKIWGGTRGRDIDIRQLIYFGV